MSNAVFAHHASAATFLGAVGKQTLIHVSRPKPDGPVELSALIHMPVPPVVHFYRILETPSRTLAQYCQVLQQLGYNVIYRDTWTQECVNEFFSYADSLIQADRTARRNYWYGHTGPAVYDEHVNMQNIPVTRTPAGKLLRSLFKSDVEPIVGLDFKEAPELRASASSMPHDLQQDVCSVSGNKLPTGTLDGSPVTIEAIPGGKKLCDVDAVDAFNQKLYQGMGVPESCVRMAPNQTSTQVLSKLVDIPIVDDLSDKALDERFHEACDKPD